MKRDIFLSLVLHVMVVLATVISSPFDYKKPFDYDQVIRIRAVAMPDFAPASGPVAEDVPIEPVSIPQAMEDDIPEIPIDKPTTVDKPKEIKKPADKPKPQKEPAQQKPKPQTETKTGIEATAGNGTGQGDKEIATGSGSPFGGATIDNASFDYPYWFTQAFNKIAGNWRQTVVIDGTAVCVIYFQVIRSGRLVETQIKESSGIPAFDQICLSAVERSAPFPPLPREFKDEIIGITLPFKYQPR